MLPLLPPVLPQPATTGTTATPTAVAATADVAMSAVAAGEQLRREYLGRLQV